MSEIALFFIEKRIKMLSTEYRAYILILFAKTLFIFWNSVTTNNKLIYKSWLHKSLQQFVAEIQAK